jgi:ATP-binding cassette subfamily F protein 3
MAVVSASGIYKYFSGESLLVDCDFTINENDKVGLIGKNGAGKSTLINMILGKEDFDANIDNNKIGSLVLDKKLSVALLSQHHDLNGENNVIEEILSCFGLDFAFKKMQEAEITLDYGEEFLEAVSLFQEKDGYKIESDIKKILNGINLEEKVWLNKISTLSGGQKSRVMLAKILVMEPDFLILDEPTNHLDLNGILWLENFLKNYKKTFLLISHDIYFLDSVVNRVIEIEAKKIKSYKGNYTEYKAQKELNFLSDVRSFEKEQDRIKKLEEFVLKYKAGQKSRQAMGRQKQLNNIERQESPYITKKNANLEFKVEYPSYNEVMNFVGLGKDFFGEVLFKNLNLKVLRGNRIGILGKNGVGKSTILKMICGKISVEMGEILLGEKIKIGYFSQDLSDLNLDNSIMDEILLNFKINEFEVRDICGTMLFSGDDVFKKIKFLSGGERARVAFIKLCLQKPNVLILDEPTNHLDIETKEILIQALEDYNGTIMAVSHDRYFLDFIVNKLLVVKREKSLLLDGNYSENKEQVILELSKREEEIKIDKNKIDMSKLNNIEKEKIRDQNKEQNKEKRAIKKELDKLLEKEKNLRVLYDAALESNNVELIIKYENEILAVEKKFFDLSEKEG